MSEKKQCPECTGFYEGDSCPTCGYKKVTIDQELKQVNKSISDTKKEIADNQEQYVKEKPKKREKFELIIPKEMAENELEEYALEMDIDCDTSDMDLEDKTAFEKATKRIVRAIQRGHLVFSDDYSEATYTPHNKRSTYEKNITFHERDGDTLKIMDRKKKSQEVGKLYAILSKITGVSPANWSKVKGEDIKVCEAILNFLMD